MSEKFGSTNTDAPVLSGLEEFGFEGKAIRMAMDGDMPWFNASDVCRSLGFVSLRDALHNHVEDEDVAKRDTLTAGGKQQANFVNESGLYALIFGSKKPAAKRFKRWVTSEVLPSIRRTGHYVASTKARTRTKVVRRGDFEMTPELFTRLYYALDKRFGATALVWFLMDRGAINTWMNGTVRSISDEIGQAVHYTTIHKYAYDLSAEGVIGMQMGDTGGGSRFMVFGAVVKRLLHAVPERELELRPGLAEISNKLLAFH